MKKMLAILCTAAVIFVMGACAPTEAPQASQASQAASSSAPAASAKQQVSLLTPFLSSVTTNEMVDTMKKEMEAKGWGVTVVDTKGDEAQLASRMEDVISSKANAIVLVSTDPSKVKTQIDSAAKAGIPVFGCDSGYIDGMVINATSDNYAMGEFLTTFLFEQIGDKGKIIALTHRPHPGVVKRCEALDKMLPEHKNISLIVEQHVDVPGPIENARKTVENLLLANPDKGSISAIWCAWDEPAIGAAQAIEAASRDEIIVAGVDGNSQAVEMIEAGSAIKGTIGQDFNGMAKIVVEEMDKVFAGQEVKKGDRYAPGRLITK
ncbi:substrate-binding domain-containing protein [Oscillospiraceae bacterium PP1C4]